MQTKPSTIRSITSFLLILFTLFFWGIVLLPNDGDKPGSAIVFSASVILGVLGLVAAAWHLYRQTVGMWLAIVVSVFVLPFALGGVVFSHAWLMKGLCAVLTTLYGLVIVLALLPSARQSFVTRPALTDEKAN